MSLISLLLLAIALSIDACVVSFAHGLILCEKKLKNSLLLAFFTGSAQAIMPVLGYFMTQPFYNMILPASKWIIFAIFMYLGLKIIEESLKNDKEVPTCLTLQCLFAIAIATGIDALAAGVTLALASVNILKASFLIGSVTFIFAFTGFWLGCSLKNVTTKYLEVLSGLILIFLAIKSLL